ncbi:unnamed protein product [Effrenium voratum]|uniref:Uncharacterized protein n=1 Tax=Effrenium voratum TaxID=2562239 RepID=A0AA36IJE5_9DINO|nr:unnamed protein product [Effrenium voratum]
MPSLLAKGPDALQMKKCYRFYIAALLPGRPFCSGVLLLPLKQACIDVDISTKQVAPHCSRGRYMEGLRKAFFPRKLAEGTLLICDSSLISFGSCCQSHFSSKPCAQNFLAEVCRSPRKHPYKLIWKHARGRYPPHRGSFAEGFDTSMQV